MRKAKNANFSDGITVLGVTAKLKDHLNRLRKAIQYHP